MRRREFVTSLGGAAVAYSLAVRAQPSGQLRRIAVLGDSPSTWNVWIAGFAERLRELGWIEDRTIAIDTAGRKGAPNESQKLPPSSSSGSPT